MLAMSWVQYIAEGTLRWRAGSGDLHRRDAGKVDFPNAFEVDKVALHREFGNFRLDDLGGAMKLLAMVLGFASGVAVEGRQAAVGAAIGMQHQDHGFGLV